MTTRTAVVLHMAVPPVLWLAAFFLVPIRFYTEIKILQTAPVFPLLMVESLRTYFTICFGAVVMLALMYLCHRARVSARRIRACVIACTILTDLAFWQTLYAKGAFSSAAAHIYTLLCCLSFCLFMVPALLLLHRMYRRLSCVRVEE